MIAFLSKLKRQNCGRKISIFMANCSILRAIKVKEFCEEQKIPVVFNIPYSL